MSSAELSDLIQQIHSRGGCATERARGVRRFGGEGRVDALPELVVATEFAVADALASQLPTCRVVIKEVNQAGMIGQVLEVACHNRRAIAGARRTGTGRLRLFAQQVGRGLVVAGDGR